MGGPAALGCRVYVASTAAGAAIVVALARSAQHNITAHVVAQRYLRVSGASTSGSFHGSGIIAGV
jgi:hypothetical protein